MKAITFFILMAAASTAFANDGKEAPSFTVQEQAIVSTELLVLRFKNIEGEDSVPQVEPQPVAPLSLLWDWNAKEEKPQIYRPFILIKQENIKKNP